MDHFTEGECSLGNPGPLNHALCLSGAPRGAMLLETVHFQVETEIYAQLIGVKYQTKRQKKNKLVFDKFGCANKTTQRILR